MSMPPHVASARTDQFLVFAFSLPDHTKARVQLGSGASSKSVHSRTTTCFVDVDAWGYVFRLLRMPGGAWLVQTGGISMGSTYGSENHCGMHDDHGQTSHRSTPMSNAADDGT